MSIYPAKNNVDACDSNSYIFCELEINEDDHYTALTMIMNCI